MESPGDRVRTEPDDCEEREFEMGAGVSNDHLLGWRDAARHPKPEDLGYEMDRWEAVEARKYDEDLLLFLPSDEELLKADAFVVASPDDVCDVENYL